jgi:hypothetical protein
MCHIYDNKTEKISAFDYSGHQHILEGMAKNHNKKKIKLIGTVA